MNVTVLLPQRTNVVAASQHQGERASNLCTPGRGFVASYTSLFKKIVNIHFFFSTYISATLFLDTVEKVRPYFAVILGCQMEGTLCGLQYYLQESTCDA